MFSKTPKVIAKGAYGCVVEPSIKCNKPTTGEEEKKRVSKIMKIQKKGDLEKIKTEFEIGTKLMSIDATHLFFLSGVYMCELGSTHDHIVRKCWAPDILRMSLSYVNIEMDKAYEFSDILDVVGTQNNLIKSFAHLVLGIGLMTKETDYVLLDIKSDNLMFMSRKNYLHPVFIDFSPSYVLRKDYNLLEYCQRWKYTSSLYFTWAPETKACVLIAQNPEREQHFKTEIMNKILQYDEIHNQGFFTNQEIHQHWYFDPFVFHYKNQENPKDKLIKDIKKSLKRLVKSDNTKDKEYSEKIMLWELARVYISILPPMEKWDKGLQQFHYHVLMQCSHPNFNKRLNCDKVLETCDQILDIHTFESLNQYCIPYEEDVLKKIMKKK